MNPLKYGFILPGGDARTAAEYASLAESCGWDGFFVWEPVWGIDAWVCLTAAAMRTQRIRLGTLLTPLSRMRPWKLASETATLDNLSNGRVILAVGLGAIDTGFAAFGEETDRKIRAELLDEGLDILTGLWRGQPFRYEGRYYKVQETSFFPPPPPVQQPRIPIWVVGAWPRQKSMQRALKYDGLLPIVSEGRHRLRPATPQDIREMKAEIAVQRGEGAPYDLIMEGTTPGDDREKARDVIQPWAEAGVTWWLEAMWEANSQPGGLEAVRQRILQGPPV